MAMVLIEADYWFFLKIGTHIGFPEDLQASGMCLMKEESQQKVITDFLLT